jgi:hypothetical protein
MARTIEDFTRRCVAQKVLETSRINAQTERPYGKTSGNYRFEEFCAGGSELQSVHAFLSNRINSLRREVKRPLIILDLGGGAGATVRELAFLYEEEVKESQMAFGVSNLVTNDLDNYTTEKARRTDPQSPYGRGKELVCNLRGSFSDLRHQTIRLANGMSVPLLGNVDIIHERYALTAWSKVPELDILHAASLLSPIGIYMVSNDSITYPEGGELDNNILRRAGISYMPDHGARREGVRQAHEYLQRPMGLKKVTRVETGPLAKQQLLYTVFKAPYAPRIFM